MSQSTKCIRLYRDFQTAMYTNVVIEFYNIFGTATIPDETR